MSGVEHARGIIDGARRFLEGERARARREAAAQAMAGGGGEVAAVNAAPGRQPEIRAALPGERQGAQWE